MLHSSQRRMAAQDLLVIAEVLAVLHQKGPAGSYAVRGSAFNLDLARMTGRALLDEDSAMAIIRAVEASEKDPGNGAKRTALEMWLAYSIGLLRTPPVNTAPVA